MAAAARGEGFEIGYDGTVQYDFAPTSGSRSRGPRAAATDGAHVANFPGVAAATADVVAAIEAVVPEIAGQDRRERTIGCRFRRRSRRRSSSASSARCRERRSPRACGARSSATALDRVMPRDRPAPGESRPLRDLSTA